MIQRLIKTLYCERGELFGITNGRRILLAKCEPKIEIMELSQSVNSIGVQGYNVKKQHVSIVLCEEPETTRVVDAVFLQTVTRFELSTDIQRTDGVFEKIVFDNLAPEEINLGGDWKFQVVGQGELTKKLWVF